MGKALDTADCELALAWDLDTNGPPAPGTFLGVLRWGDGTLHVARSTLEQMAANGADFVGLKVRELEAMLRAKPLGQDEFGVIFLLEAEAAIRIGRARAS